MPFTIQLTGFTLGASILNVDLYGCTGSFGDTIDSLHQCSGSVSSSLSDYFLMTGYTNIPKSSLNGTYVVVPDGIKTIRVKASNINDGGCIECTGTTESNFLANDFCNLTVISPNTPTPTPTVTPTLTPTPTPTVTPTPTPVCSFDATVVYGLPPTATPTPTPTPTITGPTYTPTPTPTPTETVPPPPGCITCSTGAFSSGTTDSGFVTHTYCLDLSSASNGATITLNYDAQYRLNRFNISDNVDGINGRTSGWVGADNTYTNAPYDTPGNANGSIVFIYNSARTYELSVDIAPENPSNPQNDNYQFTLICGGVVIPSTPTPTPTITPTPTDTPTPYYLQLSRCDAEPNTITGWTLNAFTQSQIMVGEIFKSIGGFYYQVINYQQAPPSPLGTIEGSKNPEGYTSCNQTPGHWVPPPPIVGNGLLVYTGETYGSSTSACNDIVYQSDAAASGTTWYLSGHTVPADGDYLYTTPYCLPLETAVGNSNYYIVFSGGTKYAMTIGSTGYISNVTTCGATPPAFTPTPTPTVTPTPTPEYFGVNILQGNVGDCSDTTSACYDFNTNQTPPNITIYTISGILGDNEIAYIGALGPDDGIFDGNNFYYTDGSSYAKITNFGVIQIYGSCTDSGSCD